MLPENQDTPLLENFAATRCEASFRGLVDRHLGLVHAAALRVTCNPTDADDVAQEVFTKLAREAGRIPSSVPLVVWFHRTTRSLALNHVRGDQRRKVRQSKAATYHAMNQDTPNSGIELHIDEVIDGLPGIDRAAVLLRYFHGLSHADVGERLGVSEDAARKRVDRALLTLQGLLSRTGITTTSAFLAATLPSYAGGIVSASLANTITTSAITAAGSAATISTLTSLLVMNATLKTAVIAVSAAALTGLGTYLVATRKAVDPLASSPIHERSKDIGTALGSSGSDHAGGPDRSRSHTRAPGADQAKPIPAGMDPEIWKAAGEIVSVIKMKQGKTKLPLNSMPDDVVLGILKRDANLGEASLAGINERLAARRERLDQVSDAIAEQTIASQEVLQEITALKLMENEGELTEDQMLRRQELVSQLESFAPLKQELSQEWYLDESLISEMRGSLTAEETASFNLFVEERRNIHLEGWAFQRSQQLAERLNLNQEQRQTVFEQLYRNRAENSDQIGGLLDGAQREAYQQGVAKDESSGK